ncbi:HNH endonuclease signature motif containing protein, partial [Arthrobacter crystallopoietes]|uniref:HNH endonuclease signature motif containing protein n=1 Tax=Crystallibacter crystallopoietes TaxID=37928 RepID=UPI003D251D7E
PGMARRIAGLAKTWLPVITDEHDKAVMVAREMRHPPEWLKRHVRLRDGTCRGLGCRTHWKHCELDHTQAWEHGGKTELDNLALRCKPDHLSKHNDGWHTTQEPHGVIRHQTRTGQTYTSYPDGVLGQPRHQTATAPATGPLHRHHPTTLLKPGRRPSSS